MLPAETNDVNLLQTKNTWNLLMRTNFYLSCPPSDCTITFAFQFCEKVGVQKEYSLKT